METKIFTDEQLVAFLDGEMTQCPASEITKALATDAQLADRLDKLTLDTGVLKESFSGLLASAPAAPEFLSQNSGKSSAKPNWMALAAAVVLALGVGFGAGQFSTSAPKPGWKAYVASYQALYSTATLASVNSSREEQSAQLTQVAAQIGKSIDLDALNVDETIEYKRAQTLNFKGKPLIQLAFLSKSGVPYALCILKTDKSNTNALDMSELENMSSASWTRDGYNYLLIGGKDAGVISKLAEKYAKTI